MGMRTLGRAREGGGGGATPAPPGGAAFPPAVPRRTRGQHGGGKGERRHPEKEHLPGHAEGHSRAFGGEGQCGADSRRRRRRDGPWPDGRRATRGRGRAAADVPAGVCPCGWTGGCNRRGAPTSVAPPGRPFTATWPPPHKTTKGGDAMAQRERERECKAIARKKKITNRIKEEWRHPSRQRPSRPRY